MTDAAVLNDVLMYPLQPGALLADLGSVCNVHQEILQMESFT